MEKKEPSYTVGGDINWCSHYGDIGWRLLKKLKLPYYPSNPTPGHISRKSQIRKDTCIPMFTAVLPTTAKTGEQPKCPLTDEWIQMW